MGKIVYDIIYGCMGKKAQIIVEGHKIDISSEKTGEYISLTGMIGGNKKTGEVIKNRIRSKSTLNFLGVWERLYNENFNVVEFDHFRLEAGQPTFTMSVKKWIEKTNAIGIIAKPGRYGGTYAHKDIAFEFASAISPEFKLFLIKEYERLKTIENNQYNLEWNVNRILAKANLKVQTDAIKDYKIPVSKYPKNKSRLEYADEADLLNVAIFGYTAKERCQENKDLCDKGLNQREFASINENLVLSRMEVINGYLIEEGKDEVYRFAYIKERARKMLTELDQEDFMKSLKRIDPSVYIDNEGLEYKPI